MSNNKVIRQRNIRYFASYYRLILFSVVVAVMVIVGSLVIGDSVRATLRNQVEERLGQSESVIFARQSMLEDSILQHPTLNGTRGYMLTEGFISYQGTMLPVMVWGTDVIDKVLINEALSKELGGVPSEDLVLRLPAAGVVPSGSMFVTDNYTTSLRVTIAGVLDADEGGNINLRNEQIHPLNIFVPRAQLNKTMEQEGKINLILADNHISDQQWTKAWNYEHSGLKIATKDGFQEITSSRIFLQDAVVESICRDNKATNRLYSYLANDIASQRDTIPYSFVTAMDCYKDVELDKNDIILSDYSALRLGVKVGVVSNKAHFATAQLCDYFFSGLVDVTIGENEEGGVRKKPAPDSIFAAMKAVGVVDFSSVVYVGDSEVDIQTAKNARVDCLCVTWGFRDKAYLVEEGGRLFVDTAVEILHYTQGAGTR